MRRLLIVFLLAFLVGCTSRAAPVPRTPTATPNPMVLPPPTVLRSIPPWEGTYYAPSIFGEETKLVITKDRFTFTYPVLGKQVFRYTFGASGLVVWDVTTDEERSWSYKWDVVEGFVVLNGITYWKK